MRWKQGILCAAVMFASPLVHGADCARDFSGEWDREPPAGTPDDVYRAEGSGWSDRIRVAQDAAGRITLESFYFSRTDLQPPLRFHYLPGEGTTENVVMVGNGAQRQVSNARWNECRLVITTKFPAVDGASSEVTVTQALWLESEAALVVETTRGAASSNRTVYRRAAPAGGK